VNDAKHDANRLGYCWPGHNILRCSPKQFEDAVSRLRCNVVVGQASAYVSTNCSALSFRVDQFMEKDREGKTVCFVGVHMFCAGKGWPQRVASSGGGLGAVGGTCVRTFRRRKRMGTQKWERILKYLKILKTDKLHITDRMN